MIFSRVKGRDLREMTTHKALLELRGMHRSVEVSEPCNRRQALAFLGLRNKRENAFVELQQDLEP